MFKKGTKTESKKYRSISLLLLISKTTEKTFNWNIPRSVGKMVYLKFDIDVCKQTFQPTLVMLS